jgi:glycosyltransferase involved in cell wall biosynthesis
VTGTPDENKIKRIIFATELGYMPYRVAGAQNAMHELNLELMARGIEPVILCGAIPGQPDDKVMREEYGGYTVYHAKQPHIVAELVLQQFRPDAAVVQGGAMTALSHAFHRAGVPTVVNFLDCEFKDGNLFAPGSPFLFVGNAPFVARRAEVLLGIECHMVQSVIRPGDFVTDTVRSHALFIGSSPLKGIEIAFRIAESRPDIPFLFVESWPIGDDIRNVYMSRAAAAGNIEWSRPVADMLPFYAKARLTLVPSIWNDSAPRVVAESQASGIPVLATDIAGLPYMVGPGGRLVDVDAPHADWLEAFDAMWNDEQEYAELSELARQHAHRAEVAPGRLAERFLALVTKYVTDERQGA